MESKSVEQFNQKKGMCGKERFRLSGLHYLSSGESVSNSCYFELYVVSLLSVWHKNDEAFDFRDSVASSAYFLDFCLIFFVKFNWLFHVVSRSATSESV